MDCNFKLSVYFKYSKLWFLFLICNSNFTLLFSRSQSLKYSKVSDIRLHRLVIRMFEFQVRGSMKISSFLKGSDRQCVVVELSLQYIMGTFFRNPQRPMRRFNGAYLFCKSANSIFKIIIVCSYLRDGFENPHRLFIFKGWF